MHIKGSVALVTGANRGLGAAFVSGLLAQGATTVYAATRSAYEPGQDGVVPVRLDITDAAQVAAVAAQLTDVDLVINNAGVFHQTQALSDELDAALRTDLETNLFGTAAVSRAFAPALAANGGGVLVNVLSVASWRSPAGFAAYGASKAAAWSITNSLRLELRQAGTLVVGVHSGYIDTDMAAAVDSAKVAPDEVVAQVLRAVENGDEEVLVDDVTRAVKAGLSADIPTIYPVTA
ncbi:MAG TPA: SDR family oxidoreductase [Pseudonocardiaceae bacterium]|jgi:NAD(P)-dependent dehydrogenase (short-subunit alcohol dehydrogenase family)|nr:SDR family oxidoreductase [Pseudonocardiaceae bacterium]